LIYTGVLGSAAQVALREQDITERLQSVFRRVLNDSSFVLPGDASSAGLRRLDSLARMHLLLEIGREFDIRFSSSEALGARSAADFLQLIRAKMGPT
jgi:acyl carrier protein